MASTGGPRGLPPWGTVASGVSCFLLAPALTPGARTSNDSPLAFDRLANIKAGRLEIRRFRVSIIVRCPRLSALRNHVQGSHSPG
eukprot:1142082-Pyramimonas_sp.AAC.2